MKRIFIALAISIVLTGCITKRPQNLKSIPALQIPKAIVKSKTLSVPLLPPVLLNTNILSYTDPIRTVTLAWCPSECTNIIAGYRLYYGSGTTYNWSPSIYSITNPCVPAIINGSNWFRAYTNMIDVGTNLTGMITNILTGNTYYFAATAYDKAGLESDYSSEVMLYTVPRPPTNTVLSIQVISNNTVAITGKTYPSYAYTLLYSSNLYTWNTLIYTNADNYGNIVYFDSTTNRSRFYRLRY